MVAHPLQVTKSLYKALMILTRGTELEISCRQGDILVRFQVPPNCDSFFFLFSSPCDYIDCGMVLS